MIQFSCPQCGQAQSADERAVGYRFRCGGCGFVGTVPEPRAAVPAGPPGFPDQAPLLMAYPRVVAPPDRTLAVVGFVLSLLGLVPCITSGLGPAGAVLGIISLVKRRPGKKMAIAAVVIGCLPVLFFIGMMGFSLTGFGGPGLFGLAGGSRANRTICQGNLNSIGIANSTYMADNDSLPAPDLQTLAAAGGLGNVIPNCPAATVTSGSSYFYFPPASGSPPTALIACDYMNNHGGKGRNVLRLDRSTAWLTEGAFQVELAKPENAAFAAALKAAEDSRQPVSGQAK